jgi:hypothetical protein
MEAEQMGYDEGHRGEEVQYEYQTQNLFPNMGAAMMPMMMVPMGSMITQQP